jgi:hypothetical protein
MKEELLKGLDYCYNRKPSTWDPAFVFRFKSNLLPKIITFISASEDQSDLEKTPATPEEAEQLFK